MNKAIALAGGFCLGLGLVNAANAQTREVGSSGVLLDGVAALVDTGVVLRSDIASRLEVVIQNFAEQQAMLPPDQRGQLPPAAELERQVLDRLILEEIQIQRAREIGIEIGDDQLNLVMAEYAAGAGVPLEQFPDWLESQGINYQQFRADQRSDLMIRTLERAEIVERIAINERELNNCLAQTRQEEAGNNEYHVSHIVLNFPLDASRDEINAAEDLAEDLVRQLDEGADFAELAATHSESQTALEGGSLGWRQGAALPTYYEDDVLAMEPGDHSDPIRAGSGFHIVRLNDKRGAEPLMVNQIRARHILLTPNELLDDEATRQRLQGIRDQIVDGDEFATVASGVSEDAGSAIEGGDLGWLTYEDLDEAFGDALQDLEIGELSQPIRSSFGWHIAELTGERVHDVTDERREDSCRNMLGNRRAEEELEVWRRRLVDEAYIVKRL